MYSVDTNLICNSFVIWSMVIYGIYIVIQGSLIVFKDKKILDIAEYIRLRIFKVLHGRDEANMYKEKLIYKKNWERFGVARIILGFLMILIFLIISKIT